MMTLQLQIDFQFTTMNSCDITGQIFYSQIQLHNFDTGRVLCHISVVFFPIPLNHKKALLQWLDMSTLCQNNFRNNRWLKESGIIME